MYFDLRKRTREKKVLTVFIGLEFANIHLPYSFNNNYSTSENSLLLPLLSIKPSYDGGITPICSLTTVAGGIEIPRTRASGVLYCLLLFGYTTTWSRSLASQRGT